MSTIYELINDKQKVDIKKYKFLNVNTFEENINLVKNYDQETDYRKLYRFVCSVRSKFCISNNRDYLNSSNLILNMKNKFQLENLSCENKHLFINDFIYPDSFQNLNGLVLNREGFNDELNQINICNECHTDINKNRVPKFALINNLYTGKTPDCLKLLNSFEESLICRYRLSCKIFKIYTNNNLSQTKIKGNVISFAQNVDDFLECIPNNDQLDNIQILFIGPTKPSMESIKKNI